MPQGHSIIYPETFDPKSILDHSDSFKIYQRTSFFSLETQNEHLIKMNQDLSYLDKLYSFIPIKSEADILALLQRFPFQAKGLVESNRHDLVFGFMAFLGKELVGAITPFTRSKDIAEIQIDVSKEYRRKKLATYLATKFILQCNSLNIQSHWDSANAASAKLAEQLRFTKQYEYQALVKTF